MSMGRPSRDPAADRRAWFFHGFRDRYLPRKLRKHFHAVRLATATRDPAAIGQPELARYLSFGASPRASINLVLGAKALAFLRGREYALPGDIRDLARDVLRHRISLSYEAEAEEITSEKIIQRVFEKVEVP